MERNQDVAKSKLDFEFLARGYFAFDEPVPYNVDNGEIYIKPITVRQSETFLASSDILAYNKNAIPSVEIIQMSYLEFLIRVVLQTEVNQAKFQNILKYCLGIEDFRIKIDENRKLYIVDKTNNLIIRHKQFEDIRRIIMYQNIPHYDDHYIDPELKKAMDATDELRNRNVTMPTLERKFAIITAHSGISKKEQMEMTFRSHCLLFEEICGEVEFTTIRPIALYAGKGKELDHWIYKKPKNKFEGYITEVDKYAQNLGTTNAEIPIANTSQYQQLYDNFKK